MLGAEHEHVPQRAGPEEGLQRLLEKAKRAPAATGTRGCPNERTIPCAAYEDNENLAQTLQKARATKRNATFFDIILGGFPCQGFTSGTSAGGMAVATCPA